MSVLPLPIGSALFHGSSASNELLLATVPVIKTHANNFESFQRHLLLTEDRGEPYWFYGPGDVCNGRVLPVFIVIAFLLKDC